MASTPVFAYSSMLPSLIPPAAKITIDGLIFLRILTFVFNSSDETLSNWRPSIPFLQSSIAWSKFSTSAITFFSQALALTLFSILVSS